MRPHCRPAPLARPASPTGGRPQGCGPQDAQAARSPGQGRRCCPRCGARPGQPPWLRNPPARHEGLRPRAARQGPICRWRPRSRAAGGRGPWLRWGGGSPANRCCPPPAGLPRGPRGRSVRLPSAPPDAGVPSGRTAARASGSRKRGPHPGAKPRSPRWLPGARRRRGAARGGRGVPPEVRGRGAVGAAGGLCGVRRPRPTQAHPSPPRLPEEPGLQASLQGGGPRECGRLLANFVKFRDSQSS